MSEYGGLAGLWEDLNKYLVVDVQTSEDSPADSKLPLVTQFTVTNSAPKSDSWPDVVYELVTLRVGVPPVVSEYRHANLARGESFTYEHRSRYADLGKITYSVEGVVTPASLLRVRRGPTSSPAGKPPLTIASYVAILKDIDLDRWLRDTIEKMLVPGLGTTEGDIELQKGKLKSAAKEIGDTRQQLDRVSSFISRPSDEERRRFTQHQKLASDYLVHTAQACGELCKALDVLNSKTLSANRDTIVSRLSQEASRLNNATEDLLAR